ncbi:MAG: hypothetical protein HY674_17100 [Chloroflexi bacterium]|nr:hypothetical protein [Chloroflexota bacterium]
MLGLILLALGLVSVASMAANRSSRGPDWFRHRPDASWEDSTIPESRSIGALIAVAGLAGHVGAFLATKDGHHRTVQIQDQARAAFRSVNEMRRKPAVKAVQLLPELEWRVSEKPAQTLRVGVAGFVLNQP